MRRLVVQRHRVSASFPLALLARMWAWPASAHEAQVIERVVTQPGFLDPHARVVLLSLGAAVDTEWRTLWSGAGWTLTADECPVSAAWPALEAWAYRLGVRRLVEHREAVARKVLYPQLMPFTRAIDELQAAADAAVERDRLHQVGMGALELGTAAMAVTVQREGPEAAAVAGPEGAA